LLFAAKNLTSVAKITETIKKAPGQSQAAPIGTYTRDASPSKDFPELASRRNNSECLAVGNLRQFKNPE
jgi:hypothetical protein